MAFGVVGAAGEGIGLAHGFTGAVGEGEVKAGEVEGPMCLAVVQVLGCVEVREVFVVCVDFELLFCPF